MNPGHPLSYLVPPTLRRLLTPAGPSSAHAQALAQLLGVAEDELDAIRLGRRYHYRPIRGAKPDGRERRILAPSPPLKRLQRRLLDEHLGRLPIHPCATAFHPGASPVFNALPHARGATIVTLDLRDFFEATRAWRVHRFFREQGWSGEPLRVLMRLCTFRDGLPQGAPTSPCLSNLVNVRLDEKLRRLAARSRGIYTRYADDLTFSWVDGGMPGGFQRAVENVLEREGYEIQPRKVWRVSRARDRPRVTGLVIAGDGRVRVPWRFRVRTVLLRWRSWLTGDPVARARWRGCQGYLRMVDRSREGARSRPRKGG
ncbi:reverse transcriptase family protein [Planctomyces sp. SH-PL62]|uniref:reverse transcriptase family protein n=1 Tax=Planctomyces sp. SH-PL62 TaxID=1636152 RepID=UPI00078C7340|nr:reverse transcriptase family protein [Planctomyces sp. SH-PL62]AMV39346.1 Reverse transcriptase (RNA-dependent DNA polymerase) [Planctomyces sp. SH-PL62]